MIKHKIIPFVPPLLEYPNYSDKEYWRSRYQDIQGPFDWYDTYETISPIIKQLNLSKRSTILHIGIGNSEFSEKMYDDVYKKSFNIDYARNVIHYMKERNKKLRASMTFETMDVLDMLYVDDQFDVVFDKAVFDCILCGIDAEKKANIFMSEVFRVIKPNGYYFLISNTEPEKRMKYLQTNNIKFDVYVKSIVNDQADVQSFKDNDGDTNLIKKDNYIYICQKIAGGGGNEENNNNISKKEEENNNETKVWS